MRRKYFWFFLFVLCIAALLPAQVSQTGSMRGLVVDTAGAPLPGVSITVSGPALIGKQAAISNENGLFRISSLPPGREYVVLAELSGFQPVKRELLIVQVGATLSVDIKMQQSDIKTEVVVTAPSPTVDTVQAKMVQTVTKEILETLPLSRSYISASQIAPGVQERRVQGGTRNDTGFMVDGVEANAANQGFAEVNISWDAIEEIELITGAVPAETGNAVGGFMNIVTKSGGNKFSGTAYAYYTDKNLSSSLFSPEQLSALGVAPPSFPLYNGDYGFSLGGPILKDRIWFFGNFTYMNRASVNTFRPTTILGKYYGQYDFPETEYLGFLKLSAQISNRFRVQIMGQLWNRPKPYNAMSWSTTAESSQKNNAHQETSSAGATYLLDDNNFLDLRLGLWRHQSNMPYSVAGTEANPRYTDAYTGYAWGSGGTNRIGQKRNYNASLKWTRFQDNFLGGDHEFKVGVEVQYGLQGADEWRQNSLSNWRYYNENPYYYRGLYNLTGPHPIYGDGQLTFTTAGTSEGSSPVYERKLRYGAFIQDSLTIKNRLTINFGLRYENIQGWMPDFVGQGADDLAKAIGGEYFIPLYGFNPYDYNKYDGWPDAMKYQSLSPSIGVVYDVFGDGRTALKLAFGQFSEQLPTSTFSAAYPGGSGAFNFYWWDQNNNGQPDAPPIDKYQQYGASPTTMLSTLYKSRIDPNIKTPYANEFSIGLEHELFPNLRVSLNYIFQDRQNVVEDVLFDLETNQRWDTYNAAQGWWIPFNTTIPAYGAFPAKDVTMYFMSKSAPAQVTRLINVPEAKRIFQGLEFSFNKRLADGWQLGGSVVYSSLKGNYSFAYSGNSWTAAFSNPNWYTNIDGTIPDAMPLVIKLYGSFVLPYNFVASFFLTHQSGTPWGRTVTVAPPTAWVAANNAQALSYAVQVEPNGTRWRAADDNLDVRIEKSVKLGRFGKLGFFVDVFNLLGSQSLNLQVNPGGTWKPADAGTTAGTYTPGSMIVTGVNGTRIFKFSLRFTF
jgi:hypothetical protein